MTGLVLAFAIIGALQPIIEIDYAASLEDHRQLRELGAELFFEKRHDRVQLQYICFGHKNFEPGQVKKLESILRRVTAESFQANANEMSQEIIRAVSHINGLEDVMLLAVFFENTFLKPLTSAPRLKRLSISFTELSSLGAVEKNNVLVELDLVYNKIDDVTGLSRLSGLEKLSLSGNPLTGSIDELLKCAKLTYLNLNNTRVTPAGIRRLVQLRQLEELDIGWTKADDATFHDLCRMPSLKKLHVYRTDISADAIKRIREKMPKLEIVETLEP